jgi:DNA (cytosine-5)-methyltransferase 1
MNNVRTFPQWWQRTADGRPVTAVVGGFPCQPFSHSGKLLGVADERWGWPWFIDAVDTVRASVVLVENVRGLLRDRQAFAWILDDLAERGFDAEWSLVSACSVGASHMRRRLFLVAYSAASGWRGGSLAEAGNAGRAG